MCDNFSTQQYIFPRQPMKFWFILTMVTNLPTNFEKMTEYSHESHRFPTGIPVLENSRLAKAVSIYPPLLIPIFSAGPQIPWDYELTYMD